MTSIGEHIGTDRQEELGAIDLYCGEAHEAPLKRTGDSVVHSNPEILGGEPVFVGTRVPVASLFEWLADGETLTDWLDSFPGVTREQALRVVEDAAEGQQFK